MQEILDRLRQLSNKDYRVFTETLNPVCKPALGVRIPDIRSLAQELVTRDDWRSILSVRSEFLEQDMLKGLIITSAKIDFDKKFELIDEFVPQIDNWNVCDTFCASLKVPTEFLPQTFRFVTPYAEATEEFPARFGFVMLKYYFINKEYIDRVMLLISACHSRGYYARMGAAWAICECIVKFEYKALPLIFNANIDKLTRKLAVSKCLASTRVSDRMKRTLREMTNTK